MMFAVITPALITGAFAERMRFGGYLLFLGLWSLLVYVPVAHWVWGGGFLGAAGVGALDFAGGTVVHVNAGAAALATALYLGRRRGFGTGALRPHNVPMVLLGAGILWFGWFGFNAGSALSAGGLASARSSRPISGPPAACSGGSCPSAFDTSAPPRSARQRAPSPASWRSRPPPATSRRCRLWRSAWPPAWCVSSRSNSRTPPTRRFARRGGRAHGRRHRGCAAHRGVREPCGEPAGADGSLAQVARQAAAVGVTLCFSFLATMAILRLVDRTVGLRVSEDVEEEGLDARSTARAPTRGAIAPTARGRSRSTRMPSSRSCASSWSWRRRAEPSRRCNSPTRWTEPISRHRPSLAPCGTHRSVGSGDPRAVSFSTWRRGTPSGLAGTFGRIQDRAIPDEDLGRILEAARRTPSSINQQAWDFVVVTGGTDFASWRRHGDTRPVAGSAATIALVVPDSDDRDERDTFQYDVGQVTMSIMLAATDLGIGSGHASVGDQALARSVLGVPEDRECAILVALGYPADRPLEPIAHPNRRVLDDVVHRERW